MEWTPTEQKKFLDEAAEAVKDNPGRTIEFECPVCAGIAYARHDGGKVIASCTGCYITQHERVG